MPQSKGSIGFIFLAAKAATVPSTCQPVHIWSCPIHWKISYFRDLQSSVGSWPNIFECCGTSHWLLNARASLWELTLGGELKYLSLCKWPDGRASSLWHKQTSLATQLSQHWAARTKSSNSRELLLKGKASQLPQAHYPWVGKIHALSFQVCQRLAQHKLSVAWPPPSAIYTYQQPKPLSTLLQGCGMATWAS